MRYFVFVFGAMTLLTPPPAFGRPVQVYDYQRLFKEAELVVIAKAIGTKKVADELFKGDKNYVGQNTEFEINHVLKGDAPGEKIELLHFKYSGDKSVINAPKLVDFRLTHEGEVEFNGSPIPEYLLFLKRMPDGRFMPVSGHVDPVDSVKKMTRPPEVEKQPSR